MSEEKLDIHNTQGKYLAAMTSLQQDKSLVPKNKEAILKFVRDIELGKMGREVGKNRVGKYICFVKSFDRVFKKPFEEVTSEEIEDYIYKLNNNKIKKTYGKGPYSNETKTTLKKALKYFWKWLKGKGVKYPDEVIWIKVNEKPVEIPSLTRNEVERIANSEHVNLVYKFIILVLFDSGARIEEALNIKFKDLFWKEDIEHPCYFIRIRFSKTKPRTISIPLYTDTINEYLRVFHSEKDPEKYLISQEYGAIRMKFKRLSEAFKLPGKKLTPHILRHSSATFYANKLKNRFQLCGRYGWTFSGKMVDRYVDRNGIQEEETANIIGVSELVELKKDYDQFSKRITEVIAGLKKDKEVNQKLIEELFANERIAQVIREEYKDKRPG